MNVKYTFNLLSQENGLEAVVRAFYRHLPVENLIAGKPTEWHLAELTIGGIFTEILASVADVVMQAFYGRQANGKPLCSRTCS